MKTLLIDLETFSSVDITKAGLYKYVQSPDFAVLLFAYAYDDGPVAVVDLAQSGALPASLVRDLFDPKIQKSAYNAAFEWYCLGKHFNVADRADWLSQWQCTQVHGLYCGYPAGLGEVGDAVGLPADKKKLAIGKALIKVFCTPQKPTANNGNRTRTLPHHEPEKWALFVEYCRQDVETERAVKAALDTVVPEDEWALWRLDTQINARGVEVTLPLIEGALAIDAGVTAELLQRARDLTGLGNPNSVAQLKHWLESKIGLTVEALNKESMPELLAATDDEDVKRVLAVRAELGKTSVSKYGAMDTAVCDDGRVRGLLQFYGANRTGRWAGRLVQVQNLPRNYLSTLDFARELVLKRDLDGLRLVYGNVPDTLSQLIRTAFVPSADHYFAIADFSAIEARVIAWLAGEQWVLEVFRTHGKIYEACAASMFGVPLERIVKGSPDYHLRAKGKVATLALGYQGGTGALVQMGALRDGIPEEDLPDIVSRWRRANKRIVELWHTVQQHALDTIEYGTVNTLPRGVQLSRTTGSFVVTLPSGRQLFYRDPHIVTGDRGPRILYRGNNQTTKKREVQDTYGGKLTENIVQAVARDCLAYAMTALEAAGYPIVMHIHDEAVLELPNGGDLTLDKAVEIMCQTPPWAAGLPLNADGFCTNYYKKD